MSHLIHQLNEIANEYMEDPVIRRFFSIPLTLPRARLRALQGVHFNKNRRDCWATLQGKSPVEVKRVIYKKEADELIEDPRSGTDHYTMHVNNCLKLGLTLQEVEESEPLPGVRAYLYSSLYFVQNTSWLEGLAFLNVIERLNNDKVIQGGGTVSRNRRRWTDEVRALMTERARPATMEKLGGADEEHTELVEGVLVRHVDSKPKEAAVLKATRESLDLHKVFYDAMSRAMEELS